MKGNHFRKNVSVSQIKDNLQRRELKVDAHTKLVRERS